MSELAAHVLPLTTRRLNMRLLGTTASSSLAFSWACRLTSDSISTTPQQNIVHCFAQDYLSLKFPSQVKHIKSVKVEVASLCTCRMCKSTSWLPRPLMDLQCQSWFSLSPQGCVWICGSCPVRTLRVFEGRAVVCRGVSGQRRINRSRSTLIAQEQIPNSQRYLSQKTSRPWP